MSPDKGVIQEIERIPSFDNGLISGYVSNFETSRTLKGWIVKTFLQSYLSTVRPARRDRRGFSSSSSASTSSLAIR